MRASLDWLSGRLKGDLKRRALLLRSRSIPPSRSLSTAVHGCWGTRVHGYMTALTVRTVRAHTVHELAKAGADAGASGRRNNAIARAAHSQPPWAARHSVTQSLIDSTVFRSSWPPRLCFYFMCTVASGLAISNRAGPGTKRQKKKHVSKGIGQGEESTQWPGLGCFICLPCPAWPGLPAIDREMPMSMSDPSKSPGAAEPLYSLVLL